MILTTIKEHKNWVNLKLIFSVNPTKVRVNNVHRRSVLTILKILQDNKSTDEKQIKKILKLKEENMRILFDLNLFTEDTPFKQTKIRKSLLIN